MTAGSSWTNTFGGSAIRPAQPSYLALTISTTTALVWPLETTEGSPSVAAMLDITATATGLELQMPPGDTGSNGAQSTVTNVGTNSFTLTDTSGNQIAVIAAGVSWLVALIDNSTTNGTWRAIQLGATTSNAQAGALAGGGLQANGSTLQTEMTPVSLNANTLITSGYRANAITWAGGTGTLTFDEIANLTTGWYCAVQNNGTGALTLGVSSGDTINGVGTAVLQPGSGGFVVAETATNFVTFGALVSALSVLNGGSGATTASGALTNYGLTSQGQSIVTASTPAQVLALLGITNSLFTESTVDTNQTLTPQNLNTAYVATAALTITLPTAAQASNKFVIAVYANGGAVTLTPQSTDSIEGQGAGVSYVLPIGGSALIICDGNTTYSVILGGDVAFNTATLNGKGTNTPTLTIRDYYASTGFGAGIAFIGANAGEETILTGSTSGAGVLALYSSGYTTLYFHVDSAGGVYANFFSASQYLETGGGAIWSSGTGAPGAGTSGGQTRGSLYSQTNGAVGSTLYVCQGSGSWLAVAGV